MTNELLGILVAVIAVSVALGGVDSDQQSRTQTGYGSNGNTAAGGYDPAERRPEATWGPCGAAGTWSSQARRIAGGPSRGHHRTDCIRLGMEAMRRKRGKDEWFSLGDVFSGQGDPEQEIQEASPQAAYHFTRLDQVDQLVEASEGDPDTGFMARLITLCSLPRTNPGNRLQYIRRNGPYTLGMIAGINNKLPYGNIPRLLLAWVCTEAVKIQSRELVLGRSLSGVHAQAGPSSCRRRHDWCADADPQSDEASL